MSNDTKQIDTDENEDKYPLSATKRLREARQRDREDLEATIDRVRDSDDDSDSDEDEDEDE